MTGLKGALSFPLSRLSTVDLELNEGQFILELIPAVVEALEPVLTDRQISIGRLELHPHLHLRLPANAAVIRQQYGGEDGVLGLVGVVRRGGHLSPFPIPHGGRNTSVNISQ